MVYQSRGRLDEAATGFRQVLTDRLRVLGPDHPDTLKTGHNLAIALQSEGRLGEGIAGLQWVLADRQRVLGPDHPHTLVTRDGLNHVLEQKPGA